MQIQFGSLPLFGKKKEVPATMVNAGGAHEVKPPMFGADTFFGKAAKGSGDPHKDTGSGSEHV